MRIKTENHSCHAEIKTEQPDEYPEFPTFSGLQPEIKQGPADIKEEAVEIMQTRLRNSLVPGKLITSPISSLPSAKSSSNVESVFNANRAK